MKKTLCLFLMLSFIFSICFADDYTDGVTAGERAAKNKSTTMWTAIGCGGGCCLNGLGCLGTTLVGFLMSPQVPMSAMGKSNEYMKGFQSSYGPKVKQKQAISAFIGGAIGALLASTAWVVYCFALGGAATLSGLFN
ncbi:MAG: hypothetical protein SVK54_02005 [candidate division WOR-3 bacterium]|nr:hypothetical protein [candidate division WOR-3 bacterium]